MTNIATNNSNKINNTSKRNKQINKSTAIIIVVVIVATYVVLKHIFGLDILNFLWNLFLLKYLPSLDTNVNYGLLFTFGILTSFHCLGMCGGIAISQTVKNTHTRAEDKEGTSPTWFVSSTLYNVGRVISYTMVGAVAGGVGHVVSFSGALNGIIPIIGGLFMIIMGINLLGIFPILRKLNIRMPLFFARKIKSGNNYGPFYVGIMSGLMPCGPLQIVQLYALGTRSVILGATSTFVFAISTVPLLFTLGAVNSIINKRYSTTISKMSAALVLILGVLMIGRGLTLSGVSYNMSCIIGNTDRQAVAIINGNIQTVTTEIQSDSYTPIVVQKGIPVKWIIRATKDNLNDCNSTIKISKFNIEENLIEGENSIEFTPLESGKISYTCWMGMIKSEIIVVDDIKKVDKH